MVAQIAASCVSIKFYDGSTSISNNKYYPQKDSSTMQPRLKILPDDIPPRVIEEAIQLLHSPGIQVGSPEAIDLLYSSGAQVNKREGIVQIPEELILKSLESVPRDFYLYNANGFPSIHYAGDEIHFDPGSSGVHILDPESLEHLRSETDDLVRIVKVSEMLSEYDAQSTAVICHDVPEEIGDFYRLYLVLLFSIKPIVTGAFSIETSKVMFELLQICAENSLNGIDKPRAIFDVCPSPPLNWTNFASQNMIDLARQNIPAQIVSMPLSGAAAPITLIGSIVQHAAECLSGITIHQLANPGASIVWGGAPAQFNMREGTTSVGSIETTMVVNGYAQVGKFLNLPTHAYLVASDSKLVDAQAGIESATSAVLGALSGINMISGAGMLDFLACQSLEKLVIDAEAIAYAKRFVQGIESHTKTLALEHFEDFTFPGNFLRHKLTRQLYKQEQYMPTDVIDRSTLRSWNEKGSADTFSRAHSRVEELISSYEPPKFFVEVERALHQIVASWAGKAGMDQLPKIMRQ
jgi:trimethylamine--corrinoid protein Co-methyltransferase